MAKKHHRRKTRQQSPVLPFGIGMLFIGIAIVRLAWPGTKSEAGEQKKSSFAPLSVSFPAPELTLKNLNGKTESLADYRSHVVLVNNWATWCPPCKAEMPVLQAYYEDHSDEGFKIVAVEAGDPRKTVSQFAQSYGLTFEVWLDPDGAALRVFGNGSLPNSYVIDRLGIVRYAWTGEVNQALLEEYVTPLLAE